jgi:tetratricopeptide (TPR) repeat protein
VYIHTAVLEQAGDVSELVGVLAHEVAHVRRRHIAEAKENEWLTQLATVAAAVLSGGHPASVALAQGINVSIQLKHTRDHEADADRHGLEYMARAGYDPRGMVRFFERIRAAEGSSPSGVPPYLFTHPALGERIPAANALIERMDLPADLRRTDPRLRDAQARLSTLLSPVAGGSGIHARALFDSARADPLLERAAQARAAGRLEEARGLLEEASALEPSDPRVPLELAELAEDRGELDEAVAQLERAFELDPQVPLVHYRLGLVHKRLGNRSQAAFHFEQAISLFGPTSSLRQRAELEVRSLSFPILQSSGLGAGGRFARDERTRFRIGESVTWWGSVSREFIARNPLVRVRWIDPAGRTAREDSVRMDPLGGLSATLETRGAAPGRWEVRVLAGDSELERRVFLLERSAPDGGA